MTPLAHLDRLQPFLAKLAARQPCLLLALGDSNACNAAFTRGAKQWPELLHTELREHYGTQKVLVLNAGVCGDTVLDALKRWPTDVARFQPDMTVVCFGSNDAGRLTDDQYRTGLEEIIDRLDAAGSAILLMTPVPIMECQPQPPHLWRGDTARQAKLAVTRAVATRRRRPLIDHYLLWQAMADRGELDMPALMHDEVHTNALGHQLVFRALAPAFGLPATLHWDRPATTAAPVAPRTTKPSGACP